MAPIKLNLFQRIMQLWDAVHPYNAVQVMLLRGRADVHLLAETWNQTLDALGLGEVELEGNQYRYVQGRSQMPLNVAPEGTSLDDFVSAEMNRPFIPEGKRSGRFSPLRPFIIPSEDSYYAGVIYHHWAADSVSIRMVLREWFLRNFDPGLARSAPVQVAQKGYWHYFGPGKRCWDLGPGIGAMLRQTTRFNTARGLVPATDDYRVRCVVQRLPDGSPEALRRAARKHHATVNDIFMAAMAQACDQHGANPPRPGKHQLALGSVVDLRPGCRQNIDELYGLFLGFTMVMARPEGLRDWDKLLHSVARQNAWQKHCHVAQMSQLRMAVGVSESWFMPLALWTKFFLKQMPVAAGISNVNMARTWAAKYHPQIILDYLRFSPTGPAIPLLVTPTSLGTASHVALTYRPSLLHNGRADRLIGTLMQRLQAVIAEGVAA